MKRYTFLEQYNYNSQKRNKSTDNEFLVIREDNITLLELSKNNSNGKITLALKVIGYTYLPLDDYSSYVKFDEKNFNFIKFLK